MTVTPATARPSFADTLAVYLKPRVLIVLFLGFSAGLPLALSSSTLLIWMREAGVDLGVIGLFALVGTPYTIKFLWAPVVDALDVPVLSPLFGRRRGWLLFSQFLLIISIALLAFCDPAVAPWYVVFSAAVDVATAAAPLVRVIGFESGRGFGTEAAWTAGSLVMAALVVIGSATALIAREPE